MKNRRKTMAKKHEEEVQENALDKIKAMESELETLKKGRIKELLSQRDAIDKELRQLGYAPREVNPAAPKAERKAKTTGKKRGRQPGSVVKCSICGKEGHTKRTHERYVTEHPEGGAPQA